MSRFVTVAKKNEVRPGTLKVVSVESKEIVLTCVGENYYAFINVCSHMDFPLNDGTLEGTTVECAHHGAQFDVRTGAAISMPAVTPIETFPVKVVGEEIQIELRDTSVGE